MSQPQWIGLYTPGADRAALVNTLESALASAGAVQYDPFGLVPGLSYQRAVKLFAAPAVGAWMRLIPSPDCVLEPVIAAASLDAPLVAGFVAADLTPALTVYSSGHPVPPDALDPYTSDLAGFLQHLKHPKTGATGVGGVSSGALPADVRAMSAKLPTKQVERLMNKMTGGLSKGERAGAQSVLQSVDWDSGAGAWMRAALAYLGLGDAVQPDYATVSTAYRTAKRLARNPNATLYPGDADARAAVPDALDYTPVFFGWKA